MDANVQSTSATTANYESINPRTFDAVYGLYNVCQLYQRSTIPANSQCLLRGVGGHDACGGASNRHCYTHKRTRAGDE